MCWRLLCVTALWGEVIGTWHVRNISSCSVINVSWHRAHICPVFVVLHKILRLAATRWRLPEPGTRQQAVAAPLGRGTQFEPGRGSGTSTSPYSATTHLQHQHALTFSSSLTSVQDQEWLGGVLPDIMDDILTFYLISEGVNMFLKIQLNSGWISEIAKLCLCSSVLFNVLNMQIL